MKKIIKRIIFVLLSFCVIIGSVFGITKVKEIYEQNNPIYQCLYGCPSVKRKKIIRKR